VEVTVSFSVSLILIVNSDLSYSKTGQSVAGLHLPFQLLVAEKDEDLRKKLVLLLVFPVLKSSACASSSGVT
jgi:hypothetical protein